MRASVLLLVLGSLALSSPLPAGLLWQVETVDGRVLASHGADTPFNPASVVKIGTSWLALDRLAPEHRFTTTFGYRGRRDRAHGLINGTLVVSGGDDPDFQLENAVLVARELNRLGVRRVSRGLAVEGDFWMGWEGGPFKRLADRAARRRLAGRRLLRALDPQRWDAAMRRTWRELAAHHGFDAARPPRVQVAGGVLLTGQTASPLVRHRSNPLRVILKRFNVYSNNDIERIADGLGGAPAVEGFLRRELAARRGRISLATGCGEGSNRMTPRLVVAMLRGFRAALTGWGLGLRDLLPVPGCDPGPVSRMFSKLTRGRWAQTVVGKTGTLTDTDGGVAVLSGSFRSAGGREILFCVAAPDAGGDLHRWRRKEQRWLLELMRAQGGAVEQPCSAPFVLSDAFATVEPVAGRRSE